MTGKLFVVPDKNPEGFIKYSSIPEGNVSDSSTLERMIENLWQKTSRETKKAIAVMDACIAGNVR